MERAVSLGMPALALTDHGNMHGVVQFYQQAEAAGIKPIIGFEAYVAPGSRLVKEGLGAKDASHHLVLLAENNAGYQNLLKLTSRSYQDGFYYKPRVDKALLGSHSEGLIAMSACLAGEIPRLLLMGDYDGAVAAARGYVEIFGRDNFFIELQDNGMEEQQRILELLCRVADEVGVGLVATNDIHYMAPEDTKAHDVLLCINTGKTLADENRMRFEAGQYYFRTPDEMRELFGRFPGAIENTGRIAERCNATLDFSTFHYPVFTPPEGKDAQVYVRELAESGFAERYPDGSAAARERMEYELSVIHDMGYDTYFLIVWDFVRFCREQNIPAGARGSGCSSVVGYCMGISAVDPIRYSLMFERFLDPERKEMPDFDIDICERNRGKVIDYVREKYGADNVAQIVTFGTLGARAAIRDVGRVMGVPLAQVNAIAKKIPSVLNITLPEAFKQEPELQQLVDSDPDIKELFDVAMKVEGLNRHSSTHAAGVVIADRPLVEYAPLCRPGGGELTTQWSMTDVAKVGLLKMDFLGLRTLTIVQTAVDLVQRTRGEVVDIDHVPLDDAKTYELFRSGETTGVFQFGSRGIRAMLRELEPDKIEDLIAANALYRPGPLGGGVVDQFIQRKHHPETIEYEHPILEECLGESYGIMATQEQVMLMVHKLAGLSMSRALTLVKAISKKKTEYIEATRADFIDGAVTNQVPKSLAERIFELIVFFGGYGFNRAHSTAYAMLAYKTAYLKAHYPVEFMAATLTCESGTIDSVIRFVEETGRMGVEVLPPCVNHSDVEFSVEDGTVRYGFVAIKGVGSKAAEAIVAARQEGGPFISLVDFCERVDLHAVNRQVIEALIRCGGFDCLGARRAQLALALEPALRIGIGAQQDREKGQMSLFGGPAQEADADRPSGQLLPDVPEWPENTLLAHEKETLGFYMSSHPLARHGELLATFSTLTARDAGGADDGTPILIGGMVDGLRTSVTRNGRAAGKRMARFNLEDLTGSIECVMFGEDYEREGARLADGEAAFLRGTVSQRMRTPSVQAVEVFPFDRIPLQFTESVVVSLRKGRATERIYAAVKKVLERNPGKARIFLEVADDDGRLLVLEPGGLKITATAALLRDLRELLGDKNVRLNPRGDRSHSNRARTWGGSWGRNGNGR